MPCNLKALMDLRIVVYFTIFFLKKRFYLFIYRERGWEGEREGEKHQCVVASHAPPTGDLACNPGMCTDRESNRRHFRSQASTQSTEPHQPGHVFFFLFDEIKNGSSVSAIPEGGKSATRVTCQGNFSLKLQNGNFVFF